MQIIRQGKDKISIYLYLAGVVPITWLALLIAPFVDKGLIEIITNLSKVINTPFKIQFCENSIKTVLFFIAIYVFVIGLYISTKKNYRRKEEHGSAKWGDIKIINKKYKQMPEEKNKILTQNVKIGLDGRKHHRNLNTLVCGGSGAGKTRFYCKPNLLQLSSSYVVLDPKGELLKSTGHLLEKKGYEIKVLDLINMEKSHCYNPFNYLKSDNDVQRLVTNLFKSTTPKRITFRRSFLGHFSINVIISFYLLFKI